MRGGKGRAGVVFVVVTAGLIIAGETLLLPPETSSLWPCPQQGLQPLDVHRLRPLESSRQVVWMVRSGLPESTQRPPPTAGRPPRAGLPLLNKTMYKREQDIAALRDASYDSQAAKGAARNDRLQKR